MSRLSREKKREQQQAADAANRAAVPVDVRVPADGSDEPGAYVDGVRVIAGPGEEIQQAVLNRLHRIAVASGHAVHATVRDERIGYVVPLRVAPDGSSAFAAQPVQLRGRGREEPSAVSGSPGIPASPETPAHATAERDHGVPRARDAAAPQPPASAPGAAGRDHSEPQDQVPSPSAGPVSEADRNDTPSEPPAPAQGTDRDRPTHLLRPVPESDAPRTLRLGGTPGASGTPGTPRTLGTPGTLGAPGTPSAPAPSDTASPSGTVPPSGAPAADPSPTARLRTLPPPEPACGNPPGTVMPPTGVFGPPPDMGGRPHPNAERTAAPDHDPDLAAAALDADPDPRPTPPRGFDAVAEAVLGDEPAAPAGSPLADPMERINDAVRAGRIDTAARLADETLEHASRTLGAEHPEVRRLRELTAYIAYLAGEPVRAFRLSLDLAVACRRAGDAEAAYGNVRSAATAWRGVRDPLLGLELGRELTALWTELAAEGGPAADEAEELDSARARMDRLTARARDQRG
ncbi:tetratricopeptide repeat protein [Streptomyces pseudogriseolus]|uniref:tetratricopeptide repeat protein n=1 Tax=Streptomyces pseudogriseolus TaxID=36817 RepID=UPI003FA30C71